MSYSKVLTSLVTQVLSDERKHMTDKTPITLAMVEEVLDRIKARYQFGHDNEQSLDDLTFYELQSDARTTWRELLEERKVAATQLLKLVEAVNKRNDFTVETLQAVLQSHGFKLETR